jgi:hypothetical protein
VVAVESLKDQGALFSLVDPGDLAEEPGLDQGGAELGTQGLPNWVGFGHRRLAKFWTWLQADGEGFDPTAISQGNQGCGKEGEAKAEAFFAILSSDLAEIVAGWDKLPNAVRAGIVAMVRSATLHRQPS